MNQADDGAELDVLAYQIADESALSSLDCNLLGVNKDGGTWLDLESVVEDAREVILRDAHYLELRGLLARDAKRPNIVRLLERAA